MTVHIGEIRMLLPSQVPALYGEGAYCVLVRTSEKDAVIERRHAYVTHSRALAALPMHACACWRAATAQQHPRAPHAHAHRTHAPTRVCSFLIFGIDCFLQVARPAS